MDKVTMVKRIRARKPQYVLLNNLLETFDISKYNNSKTKWGGV